MVIGLSSFKLLIPCYQCILFLLRKYRPVFTFRRNTLDVICVQILVLVLMRFLLAKVRIYSSQKCRKFVLEGSRCLHCVCSCDVLSFGNNELLPVSHLYVLKRWGKKLPWQHLANILLQLNIVLFLPYKLNVVRLNRIGLGP